MIPDSKTPRRDRGRFNHAHSRLRLHVLQINHQSSSINNPVRSTFSDRALFGFLGITDLDFVVAGGVSAVMSGKADRATFLKPFDEAIDSRFQAAA